MNFDKFLLANRTQGGIMMAMSIAAAWIWAPALFVSSQQAFSLGMAGLFFFCFCNTLTLGLFGYVAHRTLREFPAGYTLPEYAKSRFGTRRTHTLFVSIMMSVLMCSFATQILGATTLLKLHFDIPTWLISIIIVAPITAYIFKGGMRASIITDYIQMLIIYSALLVIVPWCIIKGGGWEVVQAGFGGVTGKYSSIFNWKVFYTFGILVSLSHLFALYADQMHWQRVFSMPPSKVRRTYSGAMLAFIVVPVSLGLLGFLAAGMVIGSGMAVPSAATVGPYLVKALLPPWVSVYFGIMILCGLGSTLDSILMASSSILSVDVLGSKTGDSPKYLVLLTAVMGLLLSNVPGITILGMFLFFGMLRLTLGAGTMLAALDKRITEPGIFWGVFLSAGINVPLYLYGTVINSFDIKFWSTIFAVLLSTGIPALVAMFSRPHNQHHQGV